MLTIALGTLRTRWVSFVGTFAALALGTALIAALGQVLITTIDSPGRGPQRYAAAPVVVVPDGLLRVNARQGETNAPLAEPRGIDPSLVRALPGAVVDRIFPAQLSGGPASVGRPWSASRTAPQTLISGRAPAAAGEIAVTSGLSVRSGTRVQVVTADGARPYTVVGVTSPGPEPTVFFTDAQAARLSPRVDALAVWAPAADVRATAGGRAMVLTGQDRALPDPNRAADEEARDNANVIAGIAAGFAAFVAVFVVSSTFAFAVGQRRREFALLRTVGATTRQVRRMVYGEAVLVALVASAVGAALGPLGTRPILGWLVGLGMAPDWMAPSASAAPSYLAFAVGLLVAVAGVAVAARRAGRIRPAEAMREAAIEPRAMTPGRWIAGLGVLGLALISMAVIAVTDPSGATSNKSFMPIVMELIAAAGLLAPAVTRPVTLLLAKPVERLRGAGGVMVSAGALASTGRTAATAAPVLVTVALAGSLLGGAAMTDAAKGAMESAPVRADYLVMPGGPVGLDKQLVARLRAIPGVDVTTATSTSVYTLEGDTVLIRRPAEAIDPAALRKALDVPVTAGSLDGLDYGSIAVSESWERGVGQSVPVWQADGTRTTLKIVALLGADSPADSYVTPRHAFSAPPSVAYVRLRSGTSPETARKALDQAVQGHNARAVTTSEWAGDASERRQSASRLGLLVVLAIMLAYTAIGLVNTLLMAASDRAGERGTLRLLGASRRQVLRYAALEALLVVAVGVVLAAGAIVLNLLGLWASLVQIAGSVGVPMPWGTVAAVTAACALLAVLGAVLPALRASSDPKAS